MAIHLTKQQYERMRRKASAVQVTEVEPPKPARRQRTRREAQMQMSQVEREAAQAFMRVALSHGWQADTIKFPCSHRESSYWHGKQYNHIVVWRGREQHMWCLCEVVEMGEAEMARVIEDLASVQ